MLINMKKSAGLYLSAREASSELAISQATLYAYVSRGLIRSEPSADSRSHRYRAEDVRTLKDRRTPAPEPPASVETTALPPPAEVPVVLPTSRIAHPWRPTYTSAWLLLMLG